MGNERTRYRLKHIYFHRLALAVHTKDNGNSRTEGFNEPYAIVYLVCPRNLFACVFTCKTIITIFVYNILFTSGGLQLCMHYILWLLAKQLQNLKGEEDKSGCCSTLLTELTY